MWRCEIVNIPVFYYYYYFATQDLQSLKESRARITDANRKKKGYKDLLKKRERGMRGKN